MNTHPSTFWYHVDHYLNEAFANEESKLYRWINDLIVFLIFYSIVCIVIESVDQYQTAYQSFFNISEAIVVGLFTIEYAANIYVAPRKKDYLLGVWGSIDFLSIAPSYLNLMAPSTLQLANYTFIKVIRVFRILRFLRMLRLLKLAKHVTRKYNERVNQFDTLKMDLQIYFIALFSVVIVFSTLMYYAESGVKGTLFTSIPQAMWWCIVTITTVGYGDMYPVTLLGRLVAAAAMLCGLALFGLLMNVIGKSMMSSLFGSANLEAGKSGAREAREALKAEHQKEHHSH